MSKRRDPDTLDLFRDYQPPEVAARFEPDVARGGTLDVKIARVLSEAMGRSGKSRAQIAAEMSDFLSQNVTENMLDCYASPARRDHKITLERFIALLDVTGCYELLGFVCDFAGFVAVPAKYAEVIQLWHTEERLAELERQRAALRGRVGGLLR
ncbi:DNA transposition protein [Ensifer sp. NBAIM29]|nr:DNA transposition protein [Ensifer sp. NBAIM29]